MMYRFSSSLRSRTAEESIKFAKQLAPELGITRVTNTTWLDKIGIPVFASIRPEADLGSLCVNAGKGLLEIEAQIGAYMEAIEFAYAEYNRSGITLIESTPKNILESYDGRIKFVDFCPLMGKTIVPEESMTAVQAHDLMVEGPVLLPAELIFIPFNSDQNKKIFGQSSNGLCSGNTVEEALVHGISELLERHTQAFNHIYDRSIFVNLDLISPKIESLINKIRNAGLILSVRYTESEIGFPYFQAFILEEIPEAPISISTGSGLHPIKEIALVRAICEAAQSRLSHIHGGRDDIINRVKYFEKVGRSIEMESIHQLRSHALSSKKDINYSAIPDNEDEVGSIPEALNFICGKLKECNIKSIAYVQLTQQNSPIKVVRVVIPSLESFDPSLKRIGPRLLNYVQNTR